MTPRDPKLDLLRRVPLFGGCGAGEIQRIAALADEVDLPAGRVLTRQGEVGHEFFIIIDGRVRIERDGALLDTLGPGAYLGEISLVDEGPRTATATAETPVRLLVVGHREFHSLMERYPGIQLQVLRTLAARVRRLEPRAAH